VTVLFEVPNQPKTVALRCTYYQSGVARSAIK